MKKIFLLLIFIILMTFSCKKDCEITNPICFETVPVELCHAYFERWFYNEESNSCKKIRYNGCSKKGFETKENCDSCKCK